MDKICSVCGKPYEFAIKVKHYKWGSECEHDNVQEPTKYRYRTLKEQEHFFYKKENPFRKILGPK